MLTGWPSVTYTPHPITLCLQFPYLLSYPSLHQTVPLTDHTTGFSTAIRDISHQIPPMTQQVIAKTLPLSLAIRLYHRPERIEPRNHSFLQTYIGSTRDLLIAWPPLQPAHCRVHDRVEATQRVMFGPIGDSDHFWGVFCRRGR